ALLPAIHAVDPADVERAKELVAAVPDRFRSVWLDTMRAKLGLGEAAGGDPELIDELFAELERHGADFTGFFRALSRLLRGDRAALDALLPDEGAMGSWIAAWRARIEGEGGDFAERAEAMDALNPLYIPRNHLVEAALAAAEAGDMTP